MRAVWVGALALTALFCAALYARYAPPEPELAFVGSSIMSTAVPPASPPDGLFGDGRHHEMLVLGAATERQAVDLIGIAVGRGFQTVFVEIFPFVRTLPSERGRELAPLPAEFLEAPWTAGVVPQWENGFNHFGKELRLAVRAAADDNWLVARATRLVAEFRTQRLDPDNGQLNVGEVPPFDFHAPRAPTALEDVLIRARAVGLTVVFVVPPGPQTVTDSLGSVADVELRATLLAFAHRFGVEVWTPALSWPDEYFADRVHLNERGRERFVEALRVRFGTQNDRD